MLCPSADVFLQRVALSAANEYASGLTDGVKAPRQLRLPEESAELLILGLVAVASVQVNDRNPTVTHFGKMLVEVRGWTSASGPFCGHCVRHPG